jgi:hypothetical protein
MNAKHTYRIRYRCKLDVGGGIKERTVRRYSVEHLLYAWLESLSDDPDWDLLAYACIDGRSAARTTWVQL